jgi:hypothetical protein
MSYLHERLKAQLGKGISQVRKNEGEPFYDIHRDIGPGFNLFYNEAMTRTAQVFFEDTAAKPVLDMIALAVMKIHKTCNEGNLMGVNMFGELYRELHKVEKGNEVYATFCAFFFQGVLCYLFSSRAMASGASSMETQTRELVGILDIVGTLTPRALRNKVLEQLCQNGVWPTNINYGPLLRQLEDFEEVILKDGELAKANVAGKNPAVGESGEGLFRVVRPEV